MKAVFVSNLSSSAASGHQRLWALRQCGVEVESLDKNQFLRRLPRLAQMAVKVLRNHFLLFHVRKLEDAIVSLCEKAEPDLVWIEWAKEFRPLLFHKLRNLKKRPFLISMQDDNPWGDRHSDQWMWRGYFKVIPEFDLHLIKRKDDEQNLKAMGAKKCRFWEHGVYPPFFHPPVDDEAILYPISFVGTCMDDRQRLIGKLLDNGLPIHVFGNYWEKRSELPSRYPANFHPPVNAQHYADVIRRSQMCLGLVSHSNKDEWTMRSYEVPACTSLLVAERTPTHERMFVDGVDAVLFSDPEECLRKLTDLLGDPSGCQAMAGRAQKKFQANGWLIQDRMKDLLAETSPPENV